MMRFLFALSLVCLCACASADRTARANAAVVGVLLAALYNPVFKEGIRDARDIAAALVAFGLLEKWKAPPWAVVLLMAVLGQWALR